MQPQEGLFHSPGLFSAAVLWRSRRTGALASLREAAGALSTELASASGLHALLAFDAALVSPAAHALPLSPPLPRASVHGRFPSTQAQALLQLAADSRERLLWALRRARAHFAAVLEPEEEVLGGRIGDGREPFGFRDGLRPPSREDVLRTAVVASGPLAGAAWLLYLRFQQDLERFGRIKPHAQALVMGRTPEGEEVPHAPADAHLARARAPGAGPTTYLIRRGFPFRQGGEEGLVFLAASADPLRFHRSLDALLGADGGPPDALLRYCTAVGGGLYLAPPRDWFHPESRREAS